MVSPTIATTKHVSLYKTTSIITVAPDINDKGIRFTNISPQIIPSSILLNIDYTNLSIDNNQYSLANHLNKNTGKLIRIKPEEGSIFTARLLSTTPDVLVLTKSGFVQKITDKDSINFPADLPIPSNRPSISVITDNINDIDKNSIRLSYSTKGIFWSPNHVMSLSNKSLTFETQAIISNLTNKDYNNVTISLMAGDISEPVNKSHPRYSPNRMSLKALTDNNQPQSVSGFYRYNITKPISLTSFETNYTPIIKYSSIPYKIENNISFTPGSSIASLNAMQVLKVNRKNRVFNNVIPAGKLMIYDISDGVSSFIGTKSIQGISKNENLSIEFGRSSDVYADISTSNRSKIKHKNTSTEKYTQHISLYNHSKKRKSITINFNIPWQKLTSSEISNKPKSFRYTYKKMHKHAKIVYKNKKGTFVIKLEPSSSIEGSINFSITR